MIARSLGSRLALLQGATIAAALLAFAGSSLWLTGRVLLQDETGLLRAEARRAAADFDQELKEEGALAAAARAVVAEGSAGAMRVDIFGPDGALLATSDGPGRSRPEARGARHLESVPAVRGVRVETSVPVAGRLRSMAALGRSLLLAALPLLVLGMIGGRWLTSRALQPLDRMRSRALEAAGRDGVRSLGEAGGLREIDDLTSAFNKLLVRLDDLLAAERRFTTDASHELRTPLTVLAGELEITMSRTDLPASSREGLARAAGQVARMTELVDALLLLRRAREMPGLSGREFEPVNLADAAREVRDDMARRRSDRAGDVSLRAPDEVMVSGHPALIHSAIGNLVDNAVKFTRPGQEIRITVESDPAETRVIVDDAGPGISGDDLPRIFDPLFRGAEARATTSGFGLGLPILRQVAQAHGGDVGVGHSPLGGARFCLTLPPWRAGQAVTELT